MRIRLQKRVSELLDQYRDRPVENWTLAEVIVQELQLNRLVCLANKAVERPGLRTIRQLSELLHQMKGDGVERNLNIPEERYLEVYERKDGKWDWRKWADRGNLPDEQVADSSGQGYESRTAAVVAATDENPDVKVIEFTPRS